MAAFYLIPTWIPPVALGGVCWLGCVLIYMTTGNR